MRHNNLLCLCGSLLIPDSLDFYKAPMCDALRVDCHCVKCGEKETVQISTEGGIFIIHNRMGGRHKSKADKWQQNTGGERWV